MKSPKNNHVKKPIKDDNIELFRQYINDDKKIKPLKSDNKVKYQPYRKKKFYQPQQQPESEIKIEALFERLSDGYQDDDIQAEDILSFCKPGVQKRTFRKLRNGQLSIGYEIDLHGHTVKQAKKTVLLLLRDSTCYGKYCIRIIHGKGKNQPNKTGGAILKSRLNSWLKQHNRVLAFHSTPRNQGGTGAVYVLLKKT